jgi:hypothetical protein
MKPIRHHALLYKPTVERVFKTLIFLCLPLPGFCADPPPTAEYSQQAVNLVLFLLILLALLFILVFRWWQKTEQASYLGEIFRESVFEFELSRRTRRVDEKRHRGELERAILATNEWKNQEFPRPPVPDPRLQNHMQSGYARIPPPGLEGNRRPGYGTNPWDDDEPHIISVDTNEMPDDIKALYEQFIKDEEKFRDDKRNWHKALDQAVTQMYQDELDKARVLAEKQAKRAADVDMGVFRGRGATFVLEFTAVVVIIFTAAILAILGKLGNEQVGTLLAAIAGYVLGRAVNPGAEKEKKSPGGAGKNYE